MMASGMLLPPSAQQQNDGSGSTYNKYMVPIRLADRDKLMRYYTNNTVLRRGVGAESSWSGPPPPLYEQYQKQ